MDPLSISAGVVAVLQAAEKIWKSLRILRTLRDAQTMADTLINEVSNMKAICHRVNLVLEDGNTRLARSSNMADLIEDALCQSSKAILELDCFIQYRLLEIPNSSQINKVSKRIWLQESHRIEILRNNLRSARQQLSQIISLSNLFQSFRVEFQIDSLALETRANSLKRIKEAEKLTSAIETNHQEIEDLRYHVNSQFQALEHHPQRTTHTTCSEQSAMTEIVRPQLNIPNFSGRPIIISAKPIRPQSTSCARIWCSCNCHNPGHLRSPKFIESVLGSVFIGYSDIPQLTPSCSLSACKERRRLPALRINYYFPQWFFSRMITTTIMYNSRDGLDIHRLRMPRIIPTASIIFNLAQTGDIEGIMSIFEKGLASPYDVDPDGFSVLWFTLNTPTPNLLSICQLLIQEGADPHECITKRNGYMPSFESAWQLILGKSVDSHCVESLKIIFDDPDRLSEFNFSDIHKRVLELDGLRLEDLDGGLDTDIDSLDNFGRTALSWAIERNDLKKVNILLSKGADPNISTTRSGWTSMHFVARAHSVNKGIITSLAKCGVEPNALDCNKQTPLARAVRHSGDSAAKVKALVGAGADPNYQYNDYRWSASHLAVFLSRHDCVRALLELGADFSLKTVLGTNVVQLAAKYCGVEMIRLLGEFKSAIQEALMDCSWIQVNEPESFRAAGTTPVTDEWRSAWIKLLEYEKTAPNFNEGSENKSGCDLHQGVTFYDALEYI